MTTFYYPFSKRKPPKRRPKNSRRLKHGSKSFVAAHKKRPYDDFELMVRDMVLDDPQLGRLMLYDKDNRDLLKFLGMV